MESPKILILEDDGTIRGVLVSRFADEGFIALEAANGEQALDIAGKERPEVIMTDIVMYPMDGLAFLKKLRASGIWGSHVPCFVFSNQDDPELLAQLKAVDIVRFVSKAETPIDELVDIVKEHIDR